MTQAHKIIAALCLSTALVGSNLAAQAQTAPAATSTTPASSPAPRALTGPNSLIVAVSGVRSARGHIRAGLVMADPNTGNVKQVGGTMAQAIEGTVTLTFNNLPDGDYAVQMFHDEDDNGEMKTNLFGIPSEGYGFSNGARAAFGPPKFADMKVTVRGNTTTVATLAY
jgi:uncharacterized protein (DUF2141 family)